MDPEFVISNFWPTYIQSPTLSALQYIVSRFEFIGKLRSWDTNQSLSENLTADTIAKKSLKLIVTTIESKFLCEDIQMWGPRFHHHHQFS